jgi:adenylate cyclase
LGPYFGRPVPPQPPPRAGLPFMAWGLALMRPTPDPAAAIRLGLRIANGIMRDHGAPAVRVGLHHGPALERDGDYFGATVNLAARVSGQAVGGEVLLTANTAALAGELDGVLYESRGRRQLRNVHEPVELVAAVAADVKAARRMAIDPVC